MNRQNSERIDEQAHSIPSRDGGRQNVKTKITSMKRAFILFWHGLTGILAGIANWCTVILGMRDDSKYGKFLRRVVGSCFAFMMVMFATAAGSALCELLYDTLKADRYFNESYYEQQYISHNVTYHSRFDEDGFVKNADGKKTITGIKWIAKPLGMDSLVCYSDGKKRGYFNMFTGKPVIEPRYGHAWIFSDGLASVDDGGWIKFIDASGKVVIDPKIPYMPDTDGYVFHNDRCVIRNGSGDRFGMIDKHGKWVLQPEFISINPSGEFWIVDNGEGKSVLDNALNTIVPFTEGDVWVTGNYISITLSSHIMQRYSHSGEMINDFYINNVEHLTYETDELHYANMKNYNEEGTLTYETEDARPRPVEKMAKCRCYEAESGWYGLMTADGKIITPPSYRCIKAIGHDMYLCKDNAEDGVILNGKGERVQ